MRPEKPVCDFGSEYELITLSQDLEDTLAHIGLPVDSDYWSAGFALVLLGNAEYDEVWVYCENSAPWLWADMVQVYPEKEVR